jgi:hypothetical protein
MPKHDYFRKRYIFEALDCQRYGGSVRVRRDLDVLDVVVDLKENLQTQSCHRGTRSVERHPKATYLGSNKRS